MEINHHFLFRKKKTQGSDIIMFHLSSLEIPNYFDLFCFPHFTHLKHSEAGVDKIPIWRTI